MRTIRKVVVILVLFLTALLLCFAAQYCYMLYFVRY